MNYIDEKLEEIEQKKQSLSKSKMEYFNHICNLIVEFSSSFVTSNELFRFRNDEITFKKVKFDENSNYYRIGFSSSGTTYSVWEEHINLTPEELKVLSDKNETYRTPRWEDDGLYLRLKRHSLFTYEKWGVSKEEAKELYNDFFNYINGLELWYLNEHLVQTFVINFNQFVKKNKGKPKYEWKF